MKTRFTASQRKLEAGVVERRNCLGVAGRFGAVRTGMHVNIWEQGRLAATLTTRSLDSHCGVPVLRVKDPTYHDSVDLGPADFAPCREDDPPETAAELLVHIHANRPLTGAALVGARQFLRQWPAGPQLPEHSGDLAPDGSAHPEDQSERPLAA